MSKKHLWKMGAFMMILSLMGCAKNVDVAVQENHVTEESTIENTSNITTSEAVKPFVAEMTTAAETKSQSIETDNMEVEEAYVDKKASQGLLFESNGDGTCNISGIGSCKDRELVIPQRSPSGDLVTGIVEKAIYSAKDLREIYILGNNLKMEKGCFSNCKIEKIVISGANVQMDEKVFAYSDDIKELVIGNSKVTIDDYALYSAGKDMEVAFHNSQIQILDKAFQSADILKMQILNCTIVAEENAFSYCDNLESLEITGGTFEAGRYCFYDSGDDANVVITDSTLSLDDNCFQSSGVKTLTIQNTTSDIAENAFSYCDELEEVIIGNGNTKIDKYAFYACEDLKMVSIGGERALEENEIELKENAFQSCGVEYVKIAGKNMEIGKSCFAYCEELQSVEIGEGNLKVKSYAFYGCPDELIITYAGNSYNKESIEKVK